MDTRALFLAVVCVAAACSDPGTERLRDTTIPTYDRATGRLSELTFDRNGNGTIDTWTRMDGARPVLARIDQNEDGRLDRWEYYDSDGKLLKVGFSRKDDGKPDAWAYAGPDGQIQRIESSSAGDIQKIDRWETYDVKGLAQVEEDTDGDGKPDTWESYENGRVRTAAFDENGDGKPDRRLVYEAGDLVAVETEPDASGRFTRRMPVKAP